jgi:predicted transcriptional regulator
MTIFKEISAEEKEVRSYVANKIYAHRRKLRLTQAELANLAGVSAPLIVHLENSNLNLRLDTLVRIAKYLNMECKLDFKELQHDNK